ncbi:MAG: hypothetical protein QM775_08090 [Pirellulales bacterium]
MTKTAKIDKFKIAFLKPKAPDKESVRIKTDLEKQIKNVKKLGKTSVAQVLTYGANDLRKKDPKYMSDLLGYKIIKHWDEPEELKLWAANFGNPQEVADVISALLKSKKSPQMALECWRMLGDDYRISSICFEIAPDLLVNEAVDMIGQNKIPTVTGEKFKAAVAAKTFRKLGPDKVPDVYKRTLTVDDAEDLADTDPVGFAKTFLTGVDPKNVTTLLRSPNVREALRKIKTDDDKPENKHKKKGKTEYDKLCENAPLLRYMDSVGERLAKLPKDLPPARLTGVIFEELLSKDNVLGMTYYTNSLTSVDELLGSSREKQIKKIDDKKELMKSKLKEGEVDPNLESHPDVPGAQCDELVSLLTALTAGMLGLDDAQIKQVCHHHIYKGMVLTKDMSTFPGGLLPKTFGGNVYGDGPSRTGQVLFTGGADDGVANAHTILKVGDMQYDAVLGTSGKDVTDSVADEFEPWDKTGYVSQKDGTPIYVSKSKRGTGMWVVNEPGLTAATNKHGFGTGYRVTANLATYAVPTGTWVAKPTKDDKTSETESESEEK